MRSSRWKYVIVIILVILFTGGAFYIIGAIQPIDYPIILANLNGASLQFLCVNDPNHCYKTINVGSYIKFHPSSTQPELLDYVYFDGPSSIFVIVGPQDYRSLLDINPSTQQIHSTNLPLEVDQRLTLYDNGKIIIGTSRGEVFIYQQDLAVKKVHLNLSENGLVGHLIYRNNDEIVALNVIPIITDGINYNEIFIVNINNGIATRKLLKGPEVNKFGPGDSTLPGKKYAVTFDNVDEDLNNLYYFSLLGKSTGGGNQILSKFNLIQMADESSTNIDKCIDWNSGYFQYHNILYSSKRYLESSSIADMFDMDNLNPLINTDVILKNSGSTKLIITPQGNNFVLGTNDTVYVVSFTGKILKQYQIPKDWLNLDYVIMEDRN